MIKKSIFAAALISVSLVTGCASVPMASKEEDAALKQFSKPTEDKAGLYIYRDSSVGQALKKNVYVDGKLVGETANKVYFYKEVTPGEHKISTESEFSENDASFNAKAGQNYFAEQYIKMGVFVGGAGVKMVSETEGKSAVKECELAK